MTITKVKFANEQGLETGWIYIERPDLTDEEIDDIAQQCWVYPQNNQAIFNQHRFARAILRKAQEK